MRVMECRLTPTKAITESQIRSGNLRSDHSEWKFNGEQAIRERNAQRILDARNGSPHNVVDLYNRF